MRGLSLSPFHVDATRFGGSVATNRHMFGVAKPTATPASERKPRWLPAPPRRIGEGRPSAPELGEADMAAIQGKLGQAVEALVYELEAVKVEAGTVSGPMLRAEPDAYKKASDVGPYFTPQEIRTQSILDARAIDQMAGRLETGSLSSYLNQDQKNTLGTVRSDAKALIQHLEQFDLAPIEGAKTKLSEDHLRAHTALVASVVASAERDVVTAEAGSVPVIEPAERMGGLGAILAVGALIAVSLVIAEAI